jgi:hypothetical protein
VQKLDDEATCHCVHDGALVLVKPRHAHPEAVELRLPKLLGPLAQGSDEGYGLSRRRARCPSSAN